MIRAATPNDAARVAEIYNYYIINTTVTFEVDPVTTAAMEERIREVSEKYPWLVYELEGQVVGYAYAGAWKSRCAYRYSVETSVYLKNDAAGRGLGTELYRELLSRLADLKLHSVIGGMALPNDGCVALHKKFGFEKVAHFKEVGRKFEQWIDVVYYEKIV